ncbi:nitrate reductase subunit beta [Saccharolobus shibatae]|uniref:Respiratory nitrate reductase beta chain n=1 Tax=Saccharolobus shibatae TaxID=2286 RepID=A0A8F5BVI1_9CREN|nr:nitrate reductase subunit beta [Saccharolobus shibatae]QXJ32217.1 Respiratory nitrate reductase beta chain [Saccharolobus shibatae]QXJ35241.1 Respiratory nitrate reductase beta chain [Saccharolobus shibatae]
MRIRTQIVMVMNLDKCLGCHTCSITCKNVWASRPGAEYMWFNNVETRPGPGYPKRWEDQEKYKGGWVLKNGKLVLRSGGAISRLLNIFHNPHLPIIDDYYEPWSYNYEELANSEEKEHQPVARPYSLLDGKYIDAPKWGPNWNDDLAGGTFTASMDPNIEKLQKQIALEYEKTFMMYLPRLCNHCLNPACVAACPAGAIYKRHEDGIVLVDQESCRGWRFCITACPYKKVYFNWETKKSEKCTFCYPRIEAGLPTVCSETCVGRIRYLGPILYDADRILEVASTKDEKDLYEAQLSLFLNPFDPDVIAEARRQGISDAWINGAQRSPAYKMVVQWRIAFPLHPEYRTLPMIFYIPPLSPILDVNGKDLSPEEYIPFVDNMRIPLEYLASLFTAGDTKPIRMALLRLIAMRIHMRKITVGDVNENAYNKLMNEAGLEPSQLEEMHRLLSIAKYNERFVIPTANRNPEKHLDIHKGACGFEEIGEYNYKVAPKDLRIRNIR